MPPGNLNYSGYDVLAIYYQTEENTNPSSQDIVDFDADLFRDNDATLVKYMTRAGISTDKSTKSTVLLYSRFGPGGLPQRVAAACTYYLSTSG
jgi:hypothetical protein